LDWQREIDRKDGFIELGGLIERVRLTQKDGLTKRVDYQRGWTDRDVP
jgi:hypothetical protein